MDLDQFTHHEKTSSLSVISLIRKKRKKIGNFIITIRPSYVGYLKLKLR